MIGFVLAIAPDGAGGLGNFSESLQSALTPTGWRGIMPLDTGSSQIAASLIRDTSGILDLQISSALDDQFFVIAYGELDAPGANDLSKTILLAYQAAGLDGLGCIYGCYGAAIIDRHTGQAVLLGDGLGQRALSYAQLDGFLLISTHDILLVAAGVPPIPADKAIVSVARIGWSIGGSSLVKGISTVPAEQVVTVTVGRAPAFRLHPAHETAQRRRRAGVNIEDTRNEIVDHLVDYVRTHHRADTPLVVELSAGFDSRTVVGIACHVARHDVETFSDGPSDSHDVLVANRVASKMGTPHRAGGVKKNSPESRLGYVSDLALSTSGQATAMVAMTASDMPPAQHADSLGGDGAEVFRGYFYPKLSKEASQPYDAKKFAASLKNRFELGLSLLSSDQEVEFEASLAARLAQWTELSERISDGYDLFHMLERSGVWNQKLRRLAQGHRRRNPYYSRAASYLFLSLPGIRGRVSGVQQALMRRFSPSTLWIPLNGETVPALWTGGRIARVCSDVLTLAAKIMWKVRERVGRVGRAGSAIGDLEQVRIDNLQFHLNNDWSELFGVSSLTSQLFGEENSRRLLNAARARHRWACEVVANMVVVETFFAAARQVNPETKNRPGL